MDSLLKYSHEKLLQWTLFSTAKPTITESTINVKSTFTTIYFSWGHGLGFNGLQQKKKRYSISIIFEKGGGGSWVVMFWHSSKTTIQSATMCEPRKMLPLSQPFCKANFYLFLIRWFLTFFQPKHHPRRLHHVRHFGAGHRNLQS